MNKKIIITMAAVVAAAGLSTAAFAEKAPSEPQTETVSHERIYCVGSVSKIYVTTAVMQLADKGLVDIDAPVTGYIPEFMMADERYKDITVRMLMNHTSGLEGSLSKNEMLYDDNDNSNYGNILGLLSAQRLKAAPGEYAAYCNVGFDLLEMIVERVSGMSYTDYVRENISSKIGAENTGTPLDMFRDENNAPIYCYGNVPHDYEYCMSLGSGGIYATASDAANFGGAFFKGNETLISENAKDRMATRWDGGADEYKDNNGLGWDYVEKLHYEQAGIKVMGKGGDIGTMHAFLMVAPDEEISVSVLSAGGGSNYNELMAQELLDTVLEERGKTVDKSVGEIVISDSVSPEFKKYEGNYYMTGVSGSEILRITFDDEKMYSETLGEGSSTLTCYKPTSDGGFVKVDEKGNITAERGVLHFAEQDGKIYLKGDMTSVISGIGENHYMTFCGERIEDNAVPAEKLGAWAEHAGRPMVLYNCKYSSAAYDHPFIGIGMIDGVNGYIIGENSGEKRVLKIVGENKAEFFTTVPASANRDLIDAETGETELSDGSITECLGLSDGTKYRFADELPELTGDIGEITLDSDEAKWYRIGTDMGGGSLAAERPENSVINVYNKYRELIFTTHMTDAPSDIPLPPDGYIMFHGETGKKVKIVK